MVLLNILSNQTEFCLGKFPALSLSLPRRFKMAEDVDSQLKRMAEDLKEIIEQINTANSNQDQDQSPVS